MSRIEDDDKDVEMQALVAGLVPVQPSRDLWPGIAARIPGNHDDAQYAGRTFFTVSIRMPSIP